MRPAGVVCVALAAGGCGDALVTADYRGVPLLSIEGRIIDFSYAKEEDDLRASIFWSLTDRPAIDVSILVEHPNVATRVTFPATFEINVFSPPPMADLDPTRPFQIGTILVYADVDGDGAYDDGELRGGSDTLAIVYAHDRIEADRSPTRAAISPGFTVVRLPLPCNYDPPEPPPAVDCGVPIGASCASDEDCGEGFCLLDDAIAAFPGGYCTMYATSWGCDPIEASVISIFDTSAPPGQDDERLIYVKTCLLDSECREGYECYLEAEACMPAEPLYIDLYPDFEPMPFCVEDLIDW